MDQRGTTGFQIGFNLHSLQNQLKYFKFVFKTLNLCRDMPRHDHFNQNV